MKKRNEKRSWHHNEKSVLMAIGLGEK